MKYFVILVLLASVLAQTGLTLADLQVSNEVTSDDAAVSEEEAPVLISAEVEDEQLSEEELELQDEGVDAAGDCTDAYEPICGEDGVTYANQCRAWEKGIVLSYGGECDAQASGELTPPLAQRTVSECAQLYSPTASVQASDKMNEYHARVVSAKMNAVILMGDEYNLDVNDLRELREEFDALVDDWPADAAELKRIAAEFKVKTKSVNGLEPYRKAIQISTKAQLGDVKEDYADLFKEAKNSTKGQMLAKFDFHVCRAEALSAKLYNNGFDVSEADAKIAEVKAFRAELSVALATADFEEVRSIMKDVSSVWGQARSKVLAKERVKFHRETKEKLGGIEEKIAALGAAGEDTSALQNRYAGMKQNAIKTELKLFKGEQSRAKKYLSLANSDSESVKSQFSARVKSLKDAGHSLESLSVKKEELEAKRAEVRGKVSERVKVKVVGCPEDAMVCPGGSSVVRVLPGCEFAACPNGGVSE